MSAETQKAVDAAYEGSFGEPPTSSPKPKTGENIWLITASAQLTDLDEPGHIKDAAKQVGWHLTVFDGQFNTDTQVTGIRQAIADGADGIILFAVDCATVKAGLQDVEAAHIPVVGWESIDCDQEVDANGAVTDSGQPGLFDANLTYNNPDAPDQPVTYAELAEELFPDYQALGIIDATGGAAKIIKLKETDIDATRLVDHGFGEALAHHCPKCEVVETVNFTGADYGPTLQDKVAQAIARHPEANAVFGVFDAPGADAAAAVMASGRKDDLYVMGGEGSPTGVQLIAEDRGLDAGVGFSVHWEAWAALDAMNRLLAGEAPKGSGFPSGLGLQLYDRDHNLPKGNSFSGPVDFEAAYRAAWGVEGN
ncbi:sugar ABC transporter substrate-binding protein [Nocardioides sp. AN3]